MSDLAFQRADNEERDRPRFIALVAGLLAACFVVPSWSVPFAAAGIALMSAALGVRAWKARKSHLVASKAVFFAGSDGRHDVWLTTEDCLKHFMITGVSGAGKGSFLLEICRNALQTGSGAMMINGQGDVGVYNSLYALCREYGREDDLQVINFVNRPSPEFHSHTFNPFETGSADALTQMVVGMLSSTIEDHWNVRATLMITGIMRALVWKRDCGRIDLTMRVMVDHLRLGRIIDLAEEPEVPADIRASVNAYLSTLPGFARERGAKQGGAALDQHGYMEMQFCKSLGHLVGAYSHVFGRSKGDVDLLETISGRRILLVMMPALEKSADEVFNLGKIMVTALRAAMTTRANAALDAGYGSSLDLASWSRRRAGRQAPFFCILDDVNYYFVDGMTTMAEQARNHGISMVFSATDMETMESYHPKETRSLMAQIGNHVIMRSYSKVFFAAYSQNVTKSLGVGHALFSGSGFNCLVKLPHTPLKDVATPGKVGRLISIERPAPEGAGR